jgi:hypothetical protein
MKLLIVQLPLFSCYFIPVWSMYSHYNPFLKHTQSMLFRKCERPGLTPIQNKWQNYGFVYLTFTFLDIRREDKRLWTEW